MKSNHSCSLTTPFTCLPHRQHRATNIYLYIYCLSSVIVRKLWTICHYLAAALSATSSLLVETRPLWWTTRQCWLAGITLTTRLACLLSCKDCQDAMMKSFTRPIEGNYYYVLWEYRDQGLAVELLWCRLVQCLALATWLLYHAVSY